MSNLAHLCIFNAPHVIRTFLFFNDPAPTETYTLSLHDALPISAASASSVLARAVAMSAPASPNRTSSASRSEEHTSELQSRRDLVCRLLLEKKKNVMP